MADSQVRYQARGPAAIRPAAMDQGFAAITPPAPALVGDFAVVDIVGPLVHHFAYGMDSYDGVLARVAAACASQAREIVLKIDSPGGDVYGCFETARAIRALAAAAGKPVCSYVSGAGASAAYALACAGDQIYASSTSCVGSIGVIDLMVSVVRQDAAMGVDTATVTSGARKADGNPHVALSEDAIAAHQAHVNDLAAVFFAWVAERRGMAPEAVQALNAAVFVGARAQDVGLIDAVADFQSLQEIRKGGTITATARNVPPPGATQAMATQANSKYVDAMAALAAAAEEGDERARAAMKKMAAAVEDKKDGGDKPAPDATAEGDKPADEDKDKPAAALPEKSASSDVATVSAIAAKVAAHLSAEAQERRTLLASRADLMADPSIKAMLEGATLATIREVCATMPKAELKPAAVVTPTPGAAAGKSVGLEADEAAELKNRMGLGPNPTASVHKYGEGDLIVFGATPQQAAVIAAERGF